MPPQALALAFAASIYPPAVAAVIALGRGAQVRSRVFAFVLAAFAVTYATGTAMLFLLEELGATSTADRSASAGLELALGLLLVALAVHLRRGRTQTGGAQPDGPHTPSKIDRYLQTRRLAFVLGITLYAIPSPIYVGAVKAIADARLSVASELLCLAGTVAVMLWMIEVPMLMLLVVPVRAARTLDQTNRWFARNGRTVAVIASAAAGAYLAIRGAVDLSG